MIFADIDEVRDFPAIEARLGLGYRACLHPCTGSLHQFQKSGVMLHAITPFASEQPCLLPSRSAKRHGHMLVVGFLEAGLPLRHFKQAFNRIPIRSVSMLT